MSAIANKGDRINQTMATNAAQQYEGETVNSVRAVTNANYSHTNCRNNSNSNILNSRSSTTKSFVDENCDSSFDFISNIKDTAPTKTMELNRNTSTKSRDSINIRKSTNGRSGIMSSIHDSIPQLSTKIKT